MSWSTESGTEVPKGAIPRPQSYLVGCSSSRKENLAVSLSICQKSIAGGYKERSPRISARGSAGKNNGSTQVRVTDKPDAMLSTPEDIIYIYRSKMELSINRNQEGLRVLTN